jgi:hypothetical protein
VSERNHRSPKRRLAGAFVLPFAVALSAAACGSTAATTAYTPQTGVVVRSEALTTGIGCGTGDTQVFKFVAVAVSAGNVAAAAGVYDCFADGVLVNLQPAPLADGSYSLDFTVRIYAFNQAAYTASQAKITADVAQPNTAGGIFAAGAFATLGATYTTSCTATQQADIQVVAVCQRLAATK